MFPHFIERCEVAIGVHATPETRVQVTHQMPIARQSLERFSLQYTSIIVLKVVKHAALEDEESGTYEPFFGLRFLTELTYSTVEY